MSVWKYIPPATTASVEWVSVLNKPTAFPPATHTHTVTEVTNLQTSLDSKVNVGASIPYSVLTGTPSIPAAQVNSDWNASSGIAQIQNKPTLFSGSYTDLTGKPSLFSGAYVDLSGKPSLFSGSYVDLTNKPSTFPPSVHTHVVADVTNLQSFLDGKATLVHSHNISDTTGLQTALDNKIAIGATIPYSTLSGSPTVPVNNSFTLKGLSDTDDAAVANGYLRWNGSGASVSYSASIPYSVLTGTPTTLATAGITDGVTAGALTSALSSYATASSVTSGLATKFNTPTGTTLQYVRGDGSLATLPITSAPSQGSASRSLNTIFQISTTRAVLAIYSVQLTVTASIAGGQNGDVIFEIASDSGFTTSVQTLSIAGLGQVYTLAVALQGVQPQTGVVMGYVPVGYYARLRTVNNTGSPSYSYRSGQETLM